MGGSVTVPSSWSISASLRSRSMSWSTASGHLPPAATATRLSRPQRSLMRPLQPSGKQWSRSPDLIADDLGPFGEALAELARVVLDQHPAHNNAQPVSSDLSHRCDVRRGAACWNAPDWRIRG